VDESGRIVVAEARGKVLADQTSQMFRIVRRLWNAISLLGRSRKLFIRKLCAEVRRRRWSSRPIRRTIQIGNVSFPLDPELDASMMNAIHFGDYGLEVALHLEKFLQPGMTFVDVGANVGYFSALALNTVGPTGSVHSFEPVPDLFRRLEALAHANPQYQLACNRCALGSKAESRTIAIAGVTNAGWNTLVPNFMEPSGQVENTSVDVQRLDEYLALQGINSVDLIKIDVEGYEFPVLQGAEDFLTTTHKKPPIICEIAPQAYPRLETSLEEFCNYMARLHYRAHDLFSHAPLNISSLEFTTDVLFLANS